MERRKLVRYLVILLLVLCAPPGAESADLSTLPPTEAGLTIGFGNSDIREGKYEPYLLVFHLGTDLKPYLYCLEGHRGKLTIFIEPQINPVLNLSEYEIGMGIGLKYMYPLNDKLSLFIMASVGPHYISVETADQARGFVFADSVGAGLYCFLDHNSGFNIGYRFRHLSNAGLEYPNCGINSNFGTIGYFYFF